jgi:hypothetical protein
MLNSTPKRVTVLGTDNGDGTITGVTSGTSLIVDLTFWSTLTIWIRGVGTIGGGTLITEEADMTPAEQLENTYNGTWSQLQSQAASAVTGGAQIAIHIGPNSYRFVRVRISSNITGGGTVYVVVTGSVTA